MPAAGHLIPYNQPAASDSPRIFVPETDFATAPALNPDAAPAPTNAPSVTIRRATPADAALIRELAGRMWPIYYGHILSAATIDEIVQLFYSRARLVGRIASEVVVLAEVDDELVGYCNASLHADRIFIWSLYVDPVAREHGAEHELFRTVADLAPHLPLESDVIEGDEVTRSLHEREGMSMHSQFPNEYMGERVLETRWVLPPRA
jgi:hypothetical protein